jgi:putative OPT family oligopeptide transporter
MLTIDPRNPPNEMPDIVGEKPPANPFLASFKPHVPPSARIPELTPLPLILGTFLGALFGASSLYLVLKVGLTVSASIPVAVLSISFFRMIAKVRSATILEHNVVQTAGSAGESIAFGLGVTMPAIMILGFDLEITRVMLVAITGGLLGILMMIPLRRALIVDQHGLLKYPEGTACAEVLKAAEKTAGPIDGVTSEEQEAAAHGGKTIFSGFAIGFIYYVIDKALFGWKEIPEKIFGPPFKGGSVGIEINPALLGVGYIIGPRIGSIMCAGGVLAYLVLIPAIKFFGEHVVGPVPPGTMPIADMVPDDIREAYVLYIGAGAVAAGGIISMVRSMPLIWHGIKSGLADLRGLRGHAGATPRTDQDLSMKFVIGGVIVLLLVIMIAPQLHLQLNLLGALLIVAIGFLFTTVSSHLTGEIGSSSCPTSGMTVATLLLTCLVFVIVGWTGPAYFVTALSIGGIVCIASSNGGTTSQDLKTGFLVGSTPKSQQIAILFGTLASALLLGPILLGLNNVYTVYVPANKLDAAGAGLHAPADQLGPTEQLKGPQANEDQKAYRVWQRPDPSGGAAQRYLVNDDGSIAYLVDPGINGTHKVRPDGTTVDKFIAPKATLMSYIIKGILGRQLPWALVLLGVMIAITLEMSGIPSLAFAVGVYLPLSASSPIFVGGMMRWLVDVWLRRKKFHGQKLTEEQLVAEGDRSPGVLLASGYIAGGALAGIVIAFMTGLPKLIPINHSIEQWQIANNPFYAGDYADLLSMIPFGILCVLLYLVGRDLLLAPKSQQRSS